MVSFYKPKTSANKERSYPSLTLTIRGLSDDGRGIANDNGRTVFVDGALPEETVLATIIETRRNYSQAKIKKILQASPQRLSPPCKVFKQCGGCSVQYMELQQQLVFKQEAVLSQLSRWANVVPEQLLEPVSLNDYGYRQRIRLAVDYNRNGELFFGFREATSRRLVNIEQCLVAEPQLQLLLPLLKQWLLTLKPRVVSHIELVGAGNDIGIVIRHTRPLAIDIRRQLASLLAQQGHIYKLGFRAAKDPHWRM